MIKIAPSILSADFAKLGEEVRILKDWKADWVHFDVMDGHFVPNITFGAGMCAAVRPETDLIIDAHLMVSEPSRWIDSFAKAGADVITIHQEADPHIHKTIQAIKAHGIKAGVAINPGTSASVLESILPCVDLVLCMTVNPGFGGQSFIPEVLPKIRLVRRMLNEIGSHADIQVDGGIKPGTAELCIEAGATILVAGSSVYCSPDPAKTIRELRCGK